MNINTVEIKGCKRKLAIEIPWEEVNQKVNEIAKEIRKIAVLDGFRPGKVPLEHIKSMFAKDIKEEVLKDLVPKALENYVSQEKLVLATEPRVYDLIYVERCPLTFNVNIEILPNILLHNYKGIEIKKPEINVTEEEIKERIKELRKKDAVLEPVSDRNAKKEDYVSIKIITPDNILGEKIDNNAIYNFIVGGKWIEELLSNVVEEMMINEIKEIKLNLGDGENKLMTVQLIGIKEMKYPPIEELYKDRDGVTDEKELEESVRRELMTEKINNQDAVIKEKIIDILLDLNKFDVPNSYVKEALDNYIRNWLEEAKAHGINLPLFLINFEKIIENRKLEAEREVKKTLLLDSIAKDAGITLSEDYINAKIDKIAKDAGQNPVILRGRLKARKEYKLLEAEWRREMVLDFLLQHAKII